jgi:PilZ domain
VKRFLRSILSPRRAPARPVEAAPRFVVALPARLLLSISHDEEAAGGSPHQKLIGSTQNISASGVAVVVPSLYVGNRPVSEGGAVRITLDLHPQGTVEIGGVVVRHEALEDGERPAHHLLGVRITKMSHGDRALYLEYIGAKGWERVLAGDDRQ